MQFSKKVEQTPTYAYKETASSRAIGRARRSFGRIIINHHEVRMSARLLVAGKSAARRLVHIVKHAERLRGVTYKQGGVMVGINARWTTGRSMSEAK